jgi:dolichol-phosphate mannosyltransferase
VLLVPTYNERDNIEALVARIRKSAGEEPVLFVDDNSPDGTADEICRIQREDGNVHVMVRPGKCGFASACREGMQKILREKLADYVILLDADLSHPPEVLPRMIELLRTHPVVVGSRYVAGGGSRNWDFGRRALSFGGNLYARFLTGVPVHDMTAGFVGYRCEALRRIDLDSIRSEGYAFQMEMKFNLHRIGIEFVEVPIIFTERESGKSKFSRAIMWEGVAFPLKTLARRIGHG